ncbi:urokinase plasminogen activator surface receptor-like [Rhincodon typus]|uniref:urokinase plasminogen activator surface receptor-like n=1 Tax=Rhincodon typus TaxID=259920 RepID=UPI00202ED84D|nr:urokinase plasminogen activator surface receptor-like [Rhincodon typus]
MSASMTEICCQTNLCNNQTITEEANTTSNGLECYTCPLFGACEDPTRTVKCAGAQTWCFHSSITFSSLAFTIKGCASRTMCQNPDVLKDYGVQTQQDFFCCQGSGCNRRSSEGSLAPKPSNPVSSKEAEAGVGHLALQACSSIQYGHG